MIPRRLRLVAVPALTVLAVLAVLAGVVAAWRPGEGVILYATPVGQHPGLIAVDARTGRAFVLNGGSYAMNASGGIVEGSVSVLDTRTGALVRTIPAGTAPQAVVVDERTERVFVLNSYMHNGGHGTVTVLDAGDGRPIRTTRVGDLPQAEVLDDRDNRVFVLNLNNSLNQTHTSVSVLDATSGRLAGSIDVPAGNVDQSASALTIDEHQGRVLAVTNGQPGYGALLNIIDARRETLVSTRVVKWAGGGIGTDVTLGHAFAFGQDNIRMLDTATGRVLSSVRIKPYLNFGGAAVDVRTGRVFVVSLKWDNNGHQTNSARMLVLDARTGALLRTVSIPWPGGVAVDARMGQALVTSVGPVDRNGDPTGAGAISVLDGRSGAVLRTISLGLAPGALAIDPCAGHTLVVEGGGVMSIPDAWAWLPGWLRGRLPFLPPPGTQSRAIPARVVVLDTARLLTERR